MCSKFQIAWVGSHYYVKYGILIIAVKTVSVEVCAVQLMFLSAQGSVQSRLQRHKK